MQSKTIEKLTIHQISLDHVKETKILNKRRLDIYKLKRKKNFALYKKFKYKIFILLFYFFISYLFAFVS